MSWISQRTSEQAPSSGSTISAWAIGGLRMRGLGTHTGFWLRVQAAAMSLKQIGLVR